MMGSKFLENQTSSGQDSNVFKIEEAIGSGSCLQKAFPPGHVFRK
jgi:hypothetical protein